MSAACRCPHCGAPTYHRDRPDAAIETVVHLVAEDFGVRPSDIIAERRGNRKTILAREVAAYLSSVVLDRSAGRVAPVFRRHRSTIDHSLKAIEDRRDDPVFDARLQRLEERLQAAA